MPLNDVRQVKNPIM